MPHHVPPPDPVYGASDAWIADLVTSAIVIVREVVADLQVSVAALSALESRVSWEGPAARAFRSRADQLCGSGIQSADSLGAALDDLRTVRDRVWVILGDGGHG
ncbi:MAG TPA: hypothetical protein DCR63_03440 [Microbacterium sp.]|nr:hypothetical protein [Microbacterium sp.]